jgi:V/A-type H+-transporting ATPase subunit K
MFHVVLALLALAILLPAGAFFLGERKKKRFRRLLGVNLVSFFGLLIVGTVFLFTRRVEAAEAAAASGDGMRYLGAALSTGLATLGAGLATGSAASAALGALSENEGIMGKALIFVALAEGIAIYGMLVSFMILNG